MEGFVQLKKILQYRQNDQNQTKFKDHVRRAYEDIKNHTGKFLYGIVLLYKTILKKTPPDGATNWTNIDIFEHYIDLGKPDQDKLAAEADELDMACIYTFECNSP